MESEDGIPFLSRTVQRRALSRSGRWDRDTIFPRKTRPKAEQQEKIRLPLLPAARIMKKTAEGAGMAAVFQKQKNLKRL